MARAVKCNNCGAFADAVSTAVNKEWRLYFRAPHVLWDPAEPFMVDGMRIQYLHLCPSCGPLADNIFGQNQSTEQTSDPISS